MELPAFALSACLAVGGLLSYFFQGSVFHLLGGTAYSFLYGYCGYLMKRNANWGLEIALGCSTIMLCAGIFRSVLSKFSRPVPLMLLALGVFSTSYYGVNYHRSYPIYH